MRSHKVWVNSIFFLAVSAISSVPVGAGDWRPENDGWEYIRQAGGVELYRRSVEGSTSPALLAYTRFKASAGDVFDVVTDYSHFPDFIPSVAESRLLDTSGQTRRVYQRLELPVFVADRHYVIESENRVDSGHGDTIRIDWQLDKTQTRVLEQDSAVQPDAFSGFWRLTGAGSDEGCEAVYSIHAEPGGKIPAWLFNRAAERYVLQVVKAVRERVYRRDY